MSGRFPPDVIVLDTDGLLHARLAPGKQAPQITTARAYRLPDGTFTPGVVTPDLTNESALADVLRSVRVESGQWSRVSVLLPDSWFRINLVEMASLPEKSQEAMHAVRWSLKRTLPIDPESLRVAYETLGHSTAGVKLLVVSAVDKTLAAIERVFAAAGIEVVLIEPTGLNIWNAISVKETVTSNDRLFIYVRDHDFTTAVFRGSQPLFIRSRNFSGERTLQQELRLSASYLRDTLQAVSLERCYIAGNGVGPEVHAALTSEFNAPVSAIALTDFVEQIPLDAPQMHAELTACTGVFAS